MHKAIFRLAALVAVSAAALLTGVGAGTGAPGFVNFEVAGWPSQPAGVTCPGSSGCMNFAAEPMIRAANDGAFYASSENGLSGGTDAWRSTDGGLHYTQLDCPNCLSKANNTGFAPGGGDTDLAVAPARNAAGYYNVYVSSLSLANVDVSTSRDGGATWSLNPVTTPETLDDREWIAADGAAKVCISYHDAPQGITVGCSGDAGTTFAQFSSAIDAVHAYQVANNAIGNLAIDSASHVVYQTYSSITAPTEVTCAPQFGVPLGCDYHGVYMAVSTDGGVTFADYPVYVNPDPTVGYGHQFVNVSVDRAGNVYSVFTDNHNVFYSVSTDHGRHWTAPARINSGSAKTAIMPWAAAGDAGKLDVVYYGSSYYDGTNPPDTYPDSASWYVYFAQNLIALSPGSKFGQVQASPVVHYGGVCESGIACTGNRDLYDDFGVAASPTTGLASIVYSDDQYRSSSGRYAPEPFCSKSDNNTPNCDHTSVATQTSGGRIFAPVK
jgi:hypothetical protein